MKLKISKRDISFFLLGILFVIIVDLFLNFEESKQSFMDGYNEARKVFSIEK